MSIKTDVQETIQDVFKCDLEGISKELTYHSVDSGQAYDPETGTFMTTGMGSGGLWFDDADNSHWIGGI